MAPAARSAAIHSTDSFAVSDRFRDQKGTPPMSHRLEGFLPDLVRTYVRLIRQVHPQAFVPLEAELMEETLVWVGIEPGDPGNEPLCNAVREIARCAGYDVAKGFQLSLHWPVSENAL